VSALDDALAVGRVVAPPVYDGFTALIAERAGAAAVTVPVAGTAAQLGVEAVMVSVDELVDNVRYIATTVHVPVIADARGVADVARAVRGFQQAGAAAVIVDDGAAALAARRDAGVQIIGADDLDATITIPAGGHELSAAAVRDALAELRTGGGSAASFVGLPFDEITSLLGLDEVYALERRYAINGEAG
jgi:Phosphoenolpyruvate phosphomutase